MKDNIPGWPYYHVSRDGKVYSRKSGNWKLLRGGIIKGDPAVTLSNHGNHLSQRVYRLVALVYLPKPSSTKLVIRHLDDNPLNNHVDNLEWCSVKYNTNYNGGAYRRGASRKKPVVCLNTRKTYLSATDASKETGTSRGNLVSCLTGNRPSAGGLEWAYL